MGDLSVYRGNCHCGAHRFEVLLPELTTAAKCNCSLCCKLGSLWTFPSDGDFKVTKGDVESLASYSSGAVGVKFCQKCGTVTTGEHTVGPLKGKLAVNIRALLDVNPFKLNTENTDSKSAELPAYLEHKFAGKEPEYEAEDAKLFSGSCHCGAVTLALKSPPLDQVDLKEDNCSICVRNAWVGIYPRKAQVTIDGEDKITIYKFGRGFNGNPFCATCGVHTHSILYGPPRHIVEKLPEEKQAFVRKQLDCLPINLRVLHDIGLDTLPVKQSDEGTEGYILED